MNKSPISLDFQCPKKWNTMNPQDGGRFCDSCKIVVQDFSKTPIDKLGNSCQTENEEQLCGNFFAYQLDKPFNNWKDKIISYYQKIEISRRINKLIKPVSLLFLMFLLISTGCYRRVRGYMNSHPNKTRKPVHSANQTTLPQIEKNNCNTATLRKTSINIFTMFKNYEIDNFFFDFYSNSIITNSYSVINIVSG